jgi:hypothetical protein
MTAHEKKTQKKNLSKLDAIIEKYGGDTKVTDTKGTVVWLKKSGYSSLADLIFHDSKKN